MMEFTKTLQISSDYKDNLRPLDWQMVQYAEVVFLDKTHPTQDPIVYQLNDSKLSLTDALSISRTNPNFFSKDSFMYIGEASGVDRKQKTILLSNKNTVVYHYLVILSGTKPIEVERDDELVAALQALNDALKMKPKIPSSFSDNKSSRKKDPSSQKDMQGEILDEPSSQSSVEEFAKPWIAHSTSQDFPGNLGGYKDRLYEVQI